MARAIVCDKCGKVTLLDDKDGFKFHTHTNMYHLIGDCKDAMELDLCEDCAKELLEAVRKSGEESTNV